jgi:protein kinase C substrate 80K-H
MIFAFAVLMLPLFVQAMSVSVSSGQFNDDYCDSNDGTDETTTSACAGVSRRSYECIGDYEKLIPISRVGDGICDCCDGSDEINSAWPITCANTCLVSLAGNALSPRNIEVTV